MARCSLEYCIVQPQCIDWYRLQFERHRLKCRYVGFLVHAHMTEIEDITKLGRDC